MCGIYYKGLRSPAAEGDKAVVAYMVAAEDTDVEQVHAVVADFRNLHNKWHLLHSDFRSLGIVS